MCLLPVPVLDVEIRVWAGLSPLEACVLGVHTTAFSLCPPWSPLCVSVS